MSFDVTMSDPEFSRCLRAAAILVVDSEAGMRNVCKRALGDRCALLELAGSAEEAEALRLRFQFDILLVNVTLPGLSGLEWLARLRERGIRTHVIYMADHADLDMAIRALRTGADDFIMKPFAVEQMISSIRRILSRGQILRENSLLQQQRQNTQTRECFIGDSVVVHQMLAQVWQFAQTPSSVLVKGERGVGKRLIARTLHEASRRHGPVVMLSCGALRSEDEEAELFGEPGLLEQADKGTLVLVDVEELSQASQARLIDRLEYETSGSGRNCQQRGLDVRIIATTSIDLEAAVGNGQFRQDLHYRINVLPLDVPALRERERDVELLFEAFMQQFAVKLRRAPVELLHDDWKQLHAWHWPGNVQELRNVAERTIVLGALPADCFAAPCDRSQRQGPGFPVDLDLQSVERAHIEAVLASLDNNKSAAAKILGVSRKTLERKQALWYGPLLG